MSHRQVDEKVTVSRVEAMLRADDNEGICVLCGADASGVEPDAEAYTCEICNQERRVRHGAAAPARTVPLTRGNEEPWKSDERTSWSC